jgi:hypothetical protein
MLKYKYFILSILAIFTFIYINVKYREEYKCVGLIYDKAITSSQNGETAHYHVIIKYDDGEIEDKTGEYAYIYYEKGKSYIFTKSRLNFGK